MSPLCCAPIDKEERCPLCKNWCDSWLKCLQSLRLLCGSSVYLCEIFKHKAHKGSTKVTLSANLCFFFVYLCEISNHKAHKGNTKITLSANLCGFFAYLCETTPSKFKIHHSK